ncbi:Mak32p [Ascoidea rubescens DSM 1968]|uniref:Ribokinase-like protein n=1 Tax=Ascoidea rubescens DSM 1968 TaxID=1344418 RepID=A0A1D2VQQ1_9ASCO|nr:Ribokinase-like protein [Ascoidea rubescens DSM 1968]ODV63946.1 Ribokinase-like protein [Ascoidea rubescens DSM 1968]
MTNDHLPDAIFTSIGMFIIDEIHFPPPKPSQTNVIGGGGTFGAIGSRIILSLNNPRLVGWILDEGSDFTEEMRNEILSWDTGVIVRSSSERLTTKGWNMYGEREFRSFKFLTPKKRIDINDIVLFRSLRNSKSFHFICSPKRCSEVCAQMSQISAAPESIVVAWEPLPDDCVPENLQKCLEALNDVDIFTPNAEEASRFFQIDEPSDCLKLEELAHKFLCFMSKNNTYNTGSGVVLRCGSKGCYVVSTNNVCKWLPAYHDPILNKNPKVIDPTGGGNSFVGGFATGFILSKGDWEIAGICGNIAAGLVIEQIGTPSLTKGPNNQAIWNGEPFKDIIFNYLKISNSSISFDHLLKVLSASNF